MRLAEYAERRPGAKYVSGRSVWEVPCQVAMPSATQNELDGDAAAMLVRGGCVAIG